MSGVDAHPCNNIPQSSPVPTTPTVHQAHHDASAAIQEMSGAAAVDFDLVSAKDFYNKHNCSFPRSLDFVLWP